MGDVPSHEDYLRAKRERDNLEEKLEDLRRRRREIDKQISSTKKKLMSMKVKQSFSKLFK